MRHILPSIPVNTEKNNGKTTGLRRLIGHALMRCLALKAVAKTLLLCLCVVAAPQLFAAEPVAKSRVGGVAIGGHDTVAYHALPTETHEKAVPGQKTYSVSWKGAKWRFASKESADKFIAEPERYSPAFNGHCANALSLGRGLLKTDGTHWEIFGDQLYLFYAAKGRDRWIATDNVQPYIEAAEAEWEKLK